LKPSTRCHPPKVDPIPDDIQMCPCTILQEVRSEILSEQTINAIKSKFEAYQE
jgi:hypothetical protein